MPYRPLVHYVLNYHTHLRQIVNFSRLRAFTPVPPMQPSPEPTHHDRPSTCIACSAHLTQSFRLPPMWSRIQSALKASCTIATGTWPACAYRTRQYLQAAAGKASAKRKTAVSQAFSPVRMSRRRKVLGSSHSRRCSRLALLQSRGQTLVHVAGCPGMGTRSRSPECAEPSPGCIMTETGVQHLGSCTPSLDPTLTHLCPQPRGGCVKRYTTDYLANGTVAQLKVATASSLGRLSQSNPVSLAGNPLDRKLVRSYLHFSQKERFSSEISRLKPNQLIPRICCSWFGTCAPKCRSLRLLVCSTSPYHIRDAALFFCTANSYCTQRSGPILFPW